MHHCLKTWPEYFKEIEAGRKTFELRKDDRGFQEGDTLVLQEWSDKTFHTGQELVRRVSKIYRELPGLKQGYVIMALEEPDNLM